MSISVPRMIKVIIAGLLVVAAIVVFQIAATFIESPSGEPAGKYAKKTPLAPTVVLTGKVLAVDGSKYKTVQAAIDAAGPGDVVRLTKGVYTESLKLKDGVSLEGEDANTVTIQCDMRLAPVVTIDKCRYARISKLTLRHDNTQVSEAKPEGKWAVVQIVDSGALLDHLIVRDGGWHGIMVSSGRKNDDMVSVADCNVYNNRSYGIFVTGSGNAELKNNTCLDNKRNGITFAENAGGRLSGNLCRSNAHHGIAIADSAVVEASANTCCDNKWSGIYFCSKSPFNVRDNNCSGNGSTGIDVDSQIMVYATGNNCSRNGVNGIYLRNSASGPVIGNTCTENKVHGISIEKGSRPTVEGNTCFANKGCGIYDEGVKLGQNKLYDNNEFCQNEIQMYLMAGNFSELEDMASRIRDEKRRFANGNWQLDTFYGAFEIGYGSQPFEENVKLCKTWLSKYPSSITPRIALANSLYMQGWHLRGSGYAETVSPKAWEPFRDYLTQALAVLKEAQTLDINDPGLYTTWISVATGLENIGDIEMAFKKGIAIEPTYYPFYFYRGFAYLPKWYGKPGQYEQLAAEAADSTKDQIGQSLYYLLARAMTRQVENVQEFEEAGFDWARVKQGQMDHAKQFPASLDLETINRLCFIACSAGDREAARDYFTKIGDGWSEKLWHDLDTFKKYKTWANRKTN